MANGEDNASVAVPEAELRRCEPRRGTVPGRTAGSSFVHEREVLMPGQTEPQITEQGRPRAVVAPGWSPDDPGAQRAEVDADVVLEDLLVEDVSIDGMCGVY
jgi:mycofactocin precursor